MQEEVQKLLASAAQALASFNFEQAKTDYQQVLTRSAGNAAVMLGMAMVYNRTGEADKAKQMLAPLIEQLDKPAHSGQQSHTHSRGKRKQGSSQSRQKVLTASAETRATVYAQMGFALHQLNQLAQAKAFYERSLSLYFAEDVQKLLSQVDQPFKKPSAEQIVLAKVQQLWQGQHVAEALEVMKKAVELSPDSPVLLHGLGMLLREMKQLDQALPLVQQAIIIDPTNAIYYNDLGMIFQDRGEHQKAITFYKRAIKLDPDYAVAYSNLGVTYKHLQQFDEAVEAYQKALALKPNMAAAHNNLGNLYRMMGNKAQAQLHLLKAIELVPDYSDAKKNLAALFSEG